MIIPKSHKGLGATEYLLTFGWVIFVILAFVIVIWKLNTLGPSGTPTGGTVGFSSMRPVDWSCSSSTGELQVQWINNVGERIQVTASDGGCDYNGIKYLAGRSFDVSRQGSPVCTYKNLPGCKDTSLGDRFESEVTLQWTSSSGGGIDHTESGRVWGTAD